MLNSDYFINKIKNYNKFLNFERLIKAYNFGIKANSIQKELLVTLIQFIQLK